MADEQGASAESGPVPRGTARRIEPKTEGHSERTQQMLDATKGLNREGVLNIFATLSHHPRALTHGVALGGAFMFRSTIGDRNREIVIVRVARNARCEYEYAQHLVIAQTCGVSADECRALLRQEPGPGFSALERAIIDAVDELFGDDCVSDATWATLAAEWDEQQLIELVMLTGYYRMLAGFLNSAGVEIDPGLEGFPQGSSPS